MTHFSSSFGSRENLEENLIESRLHPTATHLRSRTVAVYTAVHR